MRNTTRTYLIGMIGILSILLMLVGCGSKQEAPAAQMVNPMREVSFDEMVETAGVPLYFPEHAEDIRYYVIEGGENPIAQLDFTLNGKAYTHRGIFAETDMQTLSGVYFAKADETAVSVRYAKGKLFTEGKTAVLFWEDVVPGVCYSLSCTDCEDSHTLQEIAQSTFYPMQEEVTCDDVTAEYPDLEGSYTDENENTVTITSAGMNKYDVTVSIVRLCRLEGTGDLTTISMDLTLEDPNGNLMYAEFYCCPDNSYTLVISDSIWNLLDSGTEFTNFSRA